jgi:serine-type D-Ala-D-Ala endopeptidase (penicillin-binding protein 7)
MKHSILTSITLSFIILLSTPAFSRRRNREKPQAKAWLVTSLDGKTVYLSNRASEVRSIASISKIVAILVIIEAGLKLDGKTKLIANDWRVAKGGCRTRLKRRKYYTNRDLLHAALLGSDNRAVPALGRAVGLNVHSLVRAMNRRVRKMGLKNTFFKEPTGINHENVSTAKEVLVFLRAASRNRIISKVMSTSHYTINGKKSLRSVIYNNTNILTRRRSRKIIAGKTGFNSKAGYCLVTAIKTKKYGNIAYIILGSTGKLRRFNDFHVLNRKLKKEFRKIAKGRGLKALAKAKTKRRKRKSFTKKVRRRKRISGKKVKRATKRLSKRKRKRRKRVTKTSSKRAKSKITRRKKQRFPRKKRNRFATKKHR